MAEGKKSFVLYSDQRGIFAKLSDEQAGKLIKHIYAYVNDENPKGDFITELSFELIKTQLKRDLKKWERLRLQRSEAGRASAESRQRNPTSVNERQRASTVNVNVNDNVSVNDNVNANATVNNKTKQKSLMSNASRSDLKELNQEYFDISKGFYELFEANQKKLGVTWNGLKKINADKFTDSIRLMMKHDGRTLDELKAVWQFLKTDSFWMQNIQSSKSLREKFDQLITKARNGNTKTQGDQLIKRLSQTDEWKSL